MTPSGSMPKDRGDELRVEGVHQVGQTGAPQRPGRNTAGVHDVTDDRQSMPRIRPDLVIFVTITWGLSVRWLSRWARQRCNTDQLAGSIGTGCGRLPSRTVRLIGSMSSTAAGRTSLLEAAVQEGQHSEEGLVGVGVGGGGPAAEQLALLVDGDGRAAEPGRALSPSDRGWGRRARFASSGRSGSTAAVRSVGAGGPWAGWPGTLRCRGRRPGPSRVLPRWSARKRARSRTMARVASMVMSARGRVPARRARSRARSSASENAWHLGPQRQSGRLRCGVGGGRPLAGRRGRSAAPGARWVKKSSSARAREPIERPGRRARSRRACG